MIEQQVAKLKGVVEERESKDSEVDWGISNKERVRGGEEGLIGGRWVLS